MDKEKVLKLASLSRIKLSEAEAESLSHEFEGILGYVGQIKEVVSDKESSTKPLIRNVMREDGSPHESGIYTEALLAEEPARSGNYFKVKKIL